jgi:hypothetical protein
MRKNGAQCKRVDDEARLLVAQTSSLPYRRLQVGRLPEVAKSADWKSATRQVGNLRYDLRARNKTNPDDEPCRVKLFVAGFQVPATPILPACQMAKEAHGCKLFSERLDVKNSRKMWTEL